MIAVNDSLAVVLLGDWNDFYMQPEWMADNVFEYEELEIGIIGHINNMDISFKAGNVIVKPNQHKVVFSSCSLDDESIAQLAKCVDNFLKKAKTPRNISYGLNVDFHDSESTILSEIIDKIADSNMLIDLGYEIKQSKIHRTITKDTKVINVDCSLENSKEHFHFNEHHESIDATDTCITEETLCHFLNETKQIIQGFGYEIED